MLCSCSTLALCPLLSLWPVQGLQVVPELECCIARIKKALDQLESRGWQYSERAAICKACALKGCALKGLNQQLAG
eukprot:scaffold45950_cov19-Tisochrysis_lutea.AAC.1